MRGKVLEVAGFEDLRANGREHLGKKVLDVLFGNDLLEGQDVQVLKQVG